MTTDNYYFLVILVVLIAVAAVLFVWLRRDRTLPSDAPAETTLERETPPAVAMPDRPVVPPSSEATPPVHGPTEIFVERHATPQHDLVPTPVVPADDAPADELTVLKGLGPKAATKLNALGILRYDQLAALSGEALAAVDAQMGPLQGRIAKDRWVEQAAYLAAGDRAGFEATFGKIGG